jgi:hypothetical protein
VGGDFLSVLSAEDGAFVANGFQEEPPFCASFAVYPWDLSIHFS